MPRPLIRDVHEWINEIPTVPMNAPVKWLPRERSWFENRGERRPCWAWLYVEIAKWNGRCSIGGRVKSILKYHHFRIRLAKRVKKGEKSPSFFLFFSKEEEGKEGGTFLIFLIWRRRNEWERVKDEEGGEVLFFFCLVLGALSFRPTFILDIVYWEVWLGRHNL